MSRRKTNADFKKEVFDLVGNEYTFLDPYVNNHTKLRVKHNKCGHIYEVRPRDFFSHHSRCPYCSGRMHKTNQQFQKEVFNLVENEYTFLDSYVTNNTKIRVKHNMCGNIYEVRPISFLKGSRCPYCAGLAKKTDIQFKQEVFDLVGNEYTFLEHYVNSYTRLRIKHNKCGNVYKVQPSAFLSGRRCPYCFGTPKKIDADFKKEVFNLVGDEYTFLDSYVNNKVKLRVRHNKCGKIYKVRPYTFLDGKRCPYCNSPRGEVIINKILKLMGIEYEYQKTFDNLKDDKPLSYDFYIPSQSVLIEYQGVQHYQPIDHFGGEDQFKIQQKHDKMKADYAKEHGYTLITVPYTEDTFSKIKKYLIKYGLM